MNERHNFRSMLRLARLAAVAALLIAGAASATTYTDNFSGKSANLNWKALDDACLTAGDGSGTIPGCPSNIAPKDTPGNGALRLTPANGNQTGAIISNFTFPTDAGLQVTFTTYTYGGDHGGTAQDGADGISFFLQDGTTPIPTTAGALGGSLGYSCSNINPKFDGLAHGYLGLGIDEYGNFLNWADNTATGIPNTNYSGVTSNGTNTWTNGQHQYQPMRIGLRGAGDVNWAALQALNPNYYNDASPNAGKVQAACRSATYVSGFNYNWWGGISSYQTTPIPYDYKAIHGGYRVLPNSQRIAAESATTRDKAYPITYKLTISSGGLLNFLYSYNNGAFQPVIANHDITQDNGPLPSLFRFGFSAGTGGSDNVHEISCFQASPAQSNSSAGTNTTQSGKFQTGTQVYLAYYNPDDWQGALVSDPVVVSNGTLSVSTVANWDASCVLTGGACPTMGTDSKGNPLNTIIAQAPSARTLLTWNGSQGIPLEWSSLTSAQQANLNTNTTSSAGTDLLAWLRGTRSDEQLQSPPGTLRARKSVLGDIIDSSPTWVGPPTPHAYPDSFSDALYGSTSAPENATGAQTYSQFAAAEATRTNVVYIGGNDGLLHGFRTGSYNSDGTYDTSSTNDGKELLGFMPSGLLASPNTVDLTNPTYGHDFFVDATPAAGDLFYNGSWHTWLVGGDGYGGAEIFALDITDPSSFSESNASSQVIGDWTGATLTHLGNTVGTPVITRMHDGQWAIIFGNGLGNNGTAGVYVGLVDPKTGAVSFQFLDTGVGSSASPDGIAYVSTADLDGDGISDYLYAGDLQGNVWRFNVTSKNASKWAVSTFGNGGPTPLFVAKDASGQVQPITTAVAVTAIKDLKDSNYRLLVLFGTGRKTPFDMSHADQYASGTQTFYGIWDWDLGGWPPVSGSSSGSGMLYSSLSGTQNITRNVLLQQSLSSQTSGTGGNTLGYRSISASNTVCWKGSNDCSSGNTQYGWYFDLPDSGEQIIYSPSVVGSAVVVNTAIPPVISASSCNTGIQSGWTMAFNIASGGGLPQSFFARENGSFAPDSSGATVVGVRVDAVGTPTTIRYGNSTYVISQTINDRADIREANTQTGTTPARVSWKEIR